jgi:hypothetical protein
MEGDYNIVKWFTAVTLLKSYPFDRSIWDSGCKSLLKKCSQVRGGYPILESEASTSCKFRRLRHTATFLRVHIDYTD